MAKIIKNIARFVVVTVSVLMLLAIFLVLLARTPRFQTFALHRLTSYLSDKLGTRIDVGSASFVFFNKLALYNVLVKDQNDDTLLAAREVLLNIRQFKPSDKIIRFGRAEVYEPDFRIIRDTSGILNLSWYIDALRGEGKEADTTKGMMISFANIDIFDGAYCLSLGEDSIPHPEGTINFSDLKLKSINAKIKDMQINSDSVSFQIKDLSFRESNGFIAGDIDMNAVIKDTRLYFSDVDIKTDSSIVRAKKIFILPRDSLSYSDFINDVRLDISLEKSLISSYDLGFFARSFKKIAETVTLTGQVTGTVAEMRGRKIEMEYSGSTRMRCDFNISGLPSIANSYIFIDFTDMMTCADDIESFNFYGRKQTELPEMLHGLGQFSFSGNFTGFTTDFVAFGTLQTERGNITTDLSLRPDENNTFRFRGMLQAHNIDLGYVTGKSDLLGGLWLHADVDGSMKSFRHLSANIEGEIDSVDINSYLYRNVMISGTYNEKVWDGTVMVRDKNLNMDILGRFDLDDVLPEFDFTMNLSHADLYRLKLEESDTLFTASALLTATFRGNTIDNLDGDLRLINSNLQNSNGKITIYDLLVRSAREGNVKLLTLRSDLADAEVRGNYNFSSAATVARISMAKLFPSKFTPPQANKSAGENNFTFDVNFKKINKLNEFIGNGMTIAEGTTITGLMNAGTSIIGARLNSREFRLAGSRFDNLALTTSIRDSVMNLSMTADMLTLPDKSMLKNMSVSLGSHPDTVKLDIKWDNKETGKARGDIRATGFFSRNRTNGPRFVISLMPSELTVNNSIWKISPAHIVIDSTLTRFDNVLISGGNNYLKLDGLISKNPRDKLVFSFSGLNLAYLNNLAGRKEKKADEEMIKMNFGGIMSGDITLSDIRKDFLFESDIRVNEFMLNNIPYGTVSLRSEWNPQRKVAVVSAMNDFEGSRYFEIDGTYNPKSRNASMTAVATRMPLNILNALVSSFASDVRGVGSGKLWLHGKINKPLLEGAVMAEDASMKVTFLQTRYRFSDSVRFTSKGIEFRNIRIYDEKNNQGHVNGILAHKSFDDMNLDFRIDFNKVLVLNTRAKDNEMFYGTAYASGSVSIKGPPDRMLFNISAKTEDNTYFYVPLNTSATVSEYPYITFIDSKESERDTVIVEEHILKTSNTIGMELKFDLEVTPEAEVQLIMDSKAGDVIRATGAGKLNISMSSKGDVKMAGNYVIEDGDYLFTLGNIMNKRFSVEEGSTITWNGGLTDADLNIKAIYRLKASLYDIYPNEALRERIPVECHLKLSDKLIRPAVGFDIVLPTADDEARGYLKLATNTEDELSKQFLYLLVMNSFCPDPALYNPSTTSSYQGTLGVTTTEMLSNQLSNWLSQISNDFDIGFAYRPGDDITPQEMEVALSTQLLNDKVSINGNFDVGGTQSDKQTSNIDFNIEYKLTERVRFKVFNRSNDNLFYETAPYTQGVGIFFRRDFNKFKDLFIRPDDRKKRKTQPEEQP